MLDENILQTKACPARFICHFVEFPYLILRDQVVKIQQRSKKMNEWNEYVQELEDKVAHGCGLH